MYLNELMLKGVAETDKVIIRSGCFFSVYFIEFTEDPV